MTRDLRHVDSAQAGDSSARVGGSSPRQPGQNSNRLLKFVGKHVCMNSILNPPGALSWDMSLGCGGEPNTACVQSVRSSRRISSASTSRLASTSAPDSRSAWCSAARSSSLSQSPGSRGNSCSSVPSGSSVGSSTTRRPWRTRASIVMRTSVASSQPPNKQMEPTRSAHSRVPPRAAHLRRARLPDPSGHVWTVASRIEETTETQRDSRWSQIRDGQ